MATKKESVKKIEKKAVVSKATKKVVVKTVVPVQKKQVKTPQSKQKPRPVVAPEEKRFWLHGGGILKDLADLHAALLAMSTEQFKYHTTSGTNHFSLWVEAVLLEPACAKDLLKAKTKKDAAKKVEEALKRYG